MDKENLNFDKEAKDILNEEVNFVPDNINKAFDEALLKVQATKKKKNYKKVAGIAAIFLSAGLLGFSVTPYARNIPVLRSIYDTFNRKIYENYDKYASDINITKESNGVGITINKVIYDGIDLEIFYTVEGDKIINKKPNSIYFHNESFKVNGEELFIGGMGSAKYDEEGKVYVGSSNYLINSGNMLPTNYKGDIIEVPDEFLLTLEINEISLVENGSIKGAWNFDIPVSNEKLKNGVSEIEINADLSSVQDGLNLDELILTPINTAIRGTTDYKGYNLINYLIIDDKGRELEKKSSSSRHENDDSIFGDIFMERYKEIYDDTESITIIPRVYVISNPPSDYAPEDNDIKWQPIETIKVKLNLNGETNLTTCNGEDYGTITKVENLEDRSYIYFKPTRGGHDVLQKIEEEGKETNVSYPSDKYYRVEEGTTKYIPETGEFVIEFHKQLEEEKEYSIFYLDNSGNEVYFFDKAITVDVK